MSDYAVSRTLAAPVDRVFNLKPVDVGTPLELTMEERPYKLFARFMNLLIRGVLTKALALDMDAVKAPSEK